MYWIMTTNEDCTQFFAKSDYYDIVLTADSWEDLVSDVDAYGKLADSVMETCNE